MSSLVYQAVGLIVLAAAMNGVYVLPMRLNRRWQWEHSWFAFTLLGVVVVPMILAALTVPDLWSIYAEVPAGTLLGMAVAGAAWGGSLVLFGRAVTLVGVAITFAVSLGTSAATGALIPLLTQHADRVATPQGLLILAGIVILLGGVALCGLAGHRRDAVPQAGAAGAASRGASMQGFVFALLSGVFGAFLNVGFALGGDLQQAAQARGASAAMMSNAVWLPCLVAGAIPGVIYCLSLMRQRGTLHALTAEARWYYWLMGALMGLLWFGSVLCYSIATVKLGHLGPVIGWPLFMSAVVVASTIAGLLTGEWRDRGTTAGPKPLHLLYGGVACLLAAMAVLAWASVGA